MPADYAASTVSAASFVTATEGSIMTFMTAPEQESPYTVALRERQLILLSSKELNWSGRGQHVEFKKSEKLPFKVRPSAIGHGCSAVVDVVICRRIKLARKSVFCRDDYTPAEILLEVEYLQRLRYCHII
jgi:hypothetical protein